MESKLINKNNFSIGEWIKVERSNNIYFIKNKFGNVYRLSNGESEIDIHKKWIYIDDECLRKNRKYKIEKLIMKINF